MGKEHNGREATNADQGYQSQVPRLLLLAEERGEAVSGKRLRTLSVPNGA